MKPIYLTISGWGPYPGKVEVDFTRFYEDHLFLVTGPTGAGKTTIFDAISFALYGDVSGSTREKSSVRSDFASPDIDTFVELTFSHKNVEYRIQRSPRYMRPKRRGEGYTTTNEVAQLYISEEEPIASVYEVNRKIEDIMGINYDQFKKIVMIAQGEFLELLVSSSKERVEILRSLFRTNKYEKLQYELKDKANGLYRDIENVKNKMDEAANLIDWDACDTLSELSEGTSYQYDRIIVALKETINEDKKRLTNLENESIHLEEAIIKQAVSISEGEQRNDMIHRLEQASIQYEELEQDKDRIEIQEEKLKNAIDANKVMSEERFYQEALLRSEALEKRISELKHKKEKLKPILDKVLSEKVDADQKETLVASLREESARLEGYLPLLKEYVEYQKTLLESKDKLLFIQEKEVIVGEKLKEHKLIQENYQIEYDSYAEIEKDIGNNNLQIEQSKSLSNSFEQGDLLIHDIHKESKELIKLQIAYEENLTKMKDARQSYQEKEEIYKNAIVGVVAKLVKEDEPCPVCGSIEHPNVAEISLEVPDEQELDKLRELVEEKRSEYDKVYQESAIKKAHLEQMEEQLFQIVSILSKEPIIQKERGQDRMIQCEKLLLQGKEAHIAWKQELHQKKEELGKRKNRRDIVKEELKKVGETICSLEENQKEYNLMSNDLNNTIEHMKGSIDRIQSRIPAELIEETKQIGSGILDNVKDKLEEILGNIKSIQEKQEIAKAQYDQVKGEVLTNDTLYENEIIQHQAQEVELANKKAGYQKSLLENNFKNEEEYKAAIIDSDSIETLEKEIKEFYSTLQSLEKLKESLKDQIKDRNYVNTLELKDQWNELKVKKEDLLQEKESIGVRSKNHKKILTSIETSLKKKQQLALEYGVVKDLDNVTRGYNKERLVFEQYVLTSYFEDVIAAANIRLKVMTNGRYELYKISKVADARTTDSLNLEVLDNYTGKKRSVKTLSGGESFKAALSLALGLSDIVQNNAGGIQIETLFIDEGFGALDTESLDHALDTLTSLSAGNRLIGIISHVNELKERIDHQIIVEKSNNGSSLKLV